MFTPNINPKRLKLWWRFLDQIVQDIDDQLKTGPRPFKNAKRSIVSDIVNTLIAHLDIILIPTLVTYIHTQKGNTKSNCSIYDSLFAEDPILILEKLERFHSQTIINVYNKCRRFKLHFYQLTNRIFKDWEEIKKLYHLYDTDSLSSMQLMCGDEHFQGAQTSILRFESGKKGFVYKPINMNVELLIQDLQSAANIWQGYNPVENRIITKYDGINYYGYLGLYAYNGKVRSLEEAKAVYYNFGKILAWGIFFKISDGHCDNIIVNAPDVHWIDLESTFHFMHDIAYQVNHLEATGLLYEAKPDNAYIGIITGIQGGTIPRLGLTSPTIYNDGTDDILVRYFKIFHPTSCNNRIFLNQELCKPEEFVSSIKEGYINELKFLCAHKENIMKIIFDFFEKLHIQVRYIIQTTASYARSIGLINHIIASRNGDIIEKIKKERKVTIIGKQKFFENFIIENELLDIVNGVIPYFYRSNKNNNLYHASGSSRKNFFDISLLNEVHTHIMNISDKEEDVKSDCEFIERALNSTSGINTFEDFKNRFSFAVFDFEKRMQNLIGSI
ncbi:DUF4135 domain-containing protein [Candidatus Cardinium hertigii]|uniref:DUF4135 domain-containing protein n=1 Tax=Candidatus Cardinium hertigii TaxID=247481 RepID=UPI003D7E0C1B